MVSAEVNGGSRMARIVALIVSQQHPQYAECLSCAVGNYSEYRT